MRLAQGQVWPVLASGAGRTGRHDEGSEQIREGHGVLAEYEEAGYLGAEAGVRKLAASGQRSAVSGQRSAVSGQRRAVVSSERRTASGANVRKWSMTSFAGQVANGGSR